MDEPPLLRPLRFLDFINEAFELSRRCFGTCVAVGAVVYVPAALLVPYALGLGLFTTAPLLATAFVLLWVLGLSAANAAVLRVLMECALGRPNSASLAWRAVLRRLPAYLVTSALAWWVASIRWLWWIVATLLVMGRVNSPNNVEGFTAVGVIALSVMMSAIWFSFLWTVMLTEKVRYRAAVRRASRLLAGHWMRVAGFALLVLLCYVLAVLLVMVLLASVLAALARSSQGAWFRALLDWFGTSVGVASFFYFAWLAVTPLILVLTVLLYIDVRVRKEALDLEWIVDKMGVEAEGDAPTSYL
jgi:hypothetical protein